MPSHLDIVIALLGVALALFGLWLRLLDLFGRLLVEHEIVLEDYCERKGIKRSQLPTRGNSLVRMIFSGKIGGGDEPAD